MKPTVSVVVLVLAVVVAASAFVVVDDIDFNADDVDFEQLDERQQTETGAKETPNVSNFKAPCEKKCIEVVSVRKCVRRVLGVCIKRATFHSCVQWSETCTNSEAAPLSIRSFEDQQWKRASIDDNDDNNVESVDEQKQLQAAITVLEAESQKIFSELYDEQVVKAEKYEYPTAKVGGSLSKENNLASVVITLTNGNRYEVVQEQGLSDTVGKQTTIIMAEALPEDWVLVETKDIQFSRVVDYIRASDSSLSNKGAVNKMMSLD